MRPRASGLLAVIPAIALLMPALDARAICNVIPAATNDFRSGIGSANRPFASPGDMVEVRVRPAVCDDVSTGFVDLDGDGTRSDDHVVTVLFTPPAPGARNAVVLAESCAGLDLGACNAFLGGGTTTCVQVNGSGQPVGLADDGQNALQFRFPDTDARLDQPNDDHTFAGPAKIVALRRNAPPGLGCQVAAQPCASLAGDTLTNGVVACVDELYALDGTCRTGPLQIDGGFGHFTALPPPTSLERMVNASGITEVRLTADEAGNALIPIDYTDLLIRIGGRPVPLLARVSAALDAFSDAPFQKIHIPTDAAEAYSTEGIVLPPVFSPLLDPSSPTNAVLFGSLDAPRGVVRIARRQVCQTGSPQPGLACTVDAECTPGTCGWNFDFDDRFFLGTGPVLLAAGQYTATRETPITLESAAQAQASGSFAFVVYEGFDGDDRNGDGDETDFVVTLRDAVTGLLRPFGPNGSEGRAVVQARSGSFTTPAVETSGNRVAFLEPEPAQGAFDTNDNGDVFDSVLRIYELDGGPATELTAGSTRTADAAPVIGGRTGAWVDNRFFFRTSEAREADQSTGRISATLAGGEPNGTSKTEAFGAPPRGAATSADGRFVTFYSAATDLVAGDIGFGDCFVRDRDTDDDGIFDEPGSVETTIASLATGGAPADAGNDECVISPSGRYVAFVTIATNLDSGGVNICGGGQPGQCEDVVVRDRVAGTTERASVDTGGGEPDERSLHPSISADARYVAFSSLATDLVAGDTNGVRDIFVRDRCESEGDPVPGCTEHTVRVSVESDGSQRSAASEIPALSANGRVVAFMSPGRVYVHDRDADGDGVLDEPGGISTQIASLTSLGGTGQGQYPSVSGDGRFVAFESSEPLVAADTNSAFDVYLRDRVAGTTERVSIASDGAQGSGVSFAPFLSQDGRFVAFATVAPDLVVPDTNVCEPFLGTGECRDVLVHDRVTGATRRVSQATDGTQADDQSYAISLSPDGRFAVFESNATNLVPNDGPTKDVFVRGVDTSDTAADRTGDAGDIDDVLLRVADLSSPPLVDGDRCPADLADATDSAVAFLRPESAGSADPPCNQVADLNGDNDTRDRIVQVDDGATVQNWHCPASDVALSATLLAALVSEADQGPAGTNWSGDGDVDDHVLAVRPLAGAPASCAAWGPTAHPGVALDVSGDVVALLTDEADLGPAGTDLNLDGDVVPNDRVLRLFGANGTAIPLVSASQQPVAPQQAEDFVMGDGFVAFRTRESAQSNGVGAACALNGDGDCLEDVLQLYVLSPGPPPYTAELRNTEQAVVPCGLPECDPRHPYRVSEDTVRFLTFEADQNADLNDDDDQLDLLVQLYNLAAGTANVVAEVVDPDALAAAAGAPLVPGTGADPLAARAPAPASQAVQVAVALGRCVEDREASCASSAACVTGEFCFAELGQSLGSCVRDTGASCYPDRPPGEQGCLAGAVCARDFVVLAISDRDADQIADAIDNCPDVPNTEQVDLDLDGVGDDVCDPGVCGCDLQTCGNGALELDEQCDDANLVDGDTCDSNCRLPVCGNGVRTGSEECDDGNQLAGDGCSPASPLPGCEIEECSNGIDDDGAGDVDFGDDPGCASLADLSERNLAVACDNGANDDGDGFTDFPDDPGCRDAVHPLENPQCQDGVSNDADGLVDFDGGQSIHGACGGGSCPPGVSDPNADGVADPDPQCVAKPYGNREKKCGIGAELALVLVALRARKRSRFKRP